MALTSLQLLLDGVLDYLPNPAEVTNYAFDNDKLVRIVMIISNAYK